MSPVCSSIHFLKVTFNGWEWTVLDNFQTCRDSVVPCVYWLKEEGKSDGDSNNFSTVYSKQPNLTICEPWTIFWFKTYKATHFKKGRDGASCDRQTALANSHLQVVRIFSNFWYLQLSFCDIFQAFAYKQYKYLLGFVPVMDFLLVIIDNNEMCNVRWASSKGRWCFQEKTGEETKDENVNIGAWFIIFTW